MFKNCCDIPIRLYARAACKKQTSSILISFSLSMPNVCQVSLKKISTRKSLYLYVAPRTFTSEYCNHCNITYLYSVEPDPCGIGQEHEVSYLYHFRLRHLLHGGGGEGGVSSAFSEIFLKFIFLTKT